MGVHGNQTKLGHLLPPQELDVPQTKTCSGSWMSYYMITIGYMQADGAVLMNTDIVPSIFIDEMMKSIGML